MIGDLYKVHADATACEVVVACSGSTAPVTVGITIFLELVYKDVRDLSPGFRYGLYSTTAKTGDDAQSILVRLGKQLTDDPFNKGKIDSATSTSSVLTITGALPAYKKSQRYEWAPISFEASASYIDSTSSRYSIINPAPRIIWGTAGVGVVTGGDNGVGYGPVVCDAEKRALAYQGITNWTAFPVDLPDMFGNPAIKYDSYDIPLSESYKAADNRVARTNQVVKIYALGGDLATTKFNGVLLAAVNL